MSLWVIIIEKASFEIDIQDEREYMYIYREGNAVYEHSKVERKSIRT